MSNTTVLAMDFGASSGRAITATFDGEKITLKEIHRFSNDPVIVNGSMYWDILRLFFEIKQSLVKAKALGKIESIAVDTWGVDFGLIDEDGNLIENPVHYRDERTKGILEEAEKLLSLEKVYDITGNQIMEINSLFQLLALKKTRPAALERADKVMFIPDLLNFFLSGEKKSEMSIASTSSLMDARTKQWSEEILEKVGISKDKLPPIVPSGTVLGTLRDDICEELSVEKIKVVTAASHDTQSAMLASPAKEKDFIFLSCGTWSLFGTELDAPVIDENSKTCNVTNETGAENKTSFLKNIIGLWLIQESRRRWAKEGNEYSFGELESLGEKSEPFACFIDPDDPLFTPSGNMPKRIREYCERTGQKVPETVGEIVRCINESLAMKYKTALLEIEKCTGKKYNAIHIVGGGSQSEQLCRFTANACGCTVYAGPVEATAFGNAAVQLIACGKIENAAKAREIISRSEEIKTYSPCDTEKWEEYYRTFKKVTEK